jgi:hypothetical protein
MAAHYRNNFCRKIYKDKELAPDCNKLDFYLKKRVPHSSTESVSCRCHQGVSNILIPYYFPDDPLGITWYVYIGQFLLMEEDNIILADLASEWLEKKLDIYDIAVLDSLTQEEKLFVKPGAIIKRSGTGLKRFVKTDISRISFIDFIRFREFALTRFQSFLDAIYNREKSPVGGLNAFNQLEDYVRTKENDAEILNLLGSLYDLLAAVMTSSPNNDSVNRSCELFKERFDPGNGENMEFFRDRADQLRGVVEQYEKNFPSRAADAANFVEALQRLSNS